MERVTMHAREEEGPDEEANHNRVKSALCIKEKDKYWLVMSVKTLLD